MAVDLLAIFTKGLWTKDRSSAPALEILSPFDVEVSMDSFEVSVEFIEEVPS